MSTLKVDDVRAEVVNIAEQLPNDPAVTQPIAAGGAGADSQWNDLFHDRLRDAIGAAAFGDPNVSGVADGMNHFAFGGVRAVRGRAVTGHLGDDAPDEAELNSTLMELLPVGDPSAQAE